MKILQLAPQFPFPESDGGKISIANIFREGSKNSEMVLICLVKELPDENQINEARKYGEVHVIKADMENSFKNIFRSLITDQSIYLMKHSFKQTIELVWTIVKDLDFDIIHADHTAMAPLAFEIKKRKSRPIGLRLHNIENTIWHRYSEVIPSYKPKKWYLSRQANLLTKSEADYITNADLNFVMTEPDKKRALDIAPDANVIVAPAGVDLERHKRQDLERDQFEMIIATNYNWVHNVDGLKWFINEVLPIVKKELPKTKLSLLGQNIPEWMTNLRKKGVEALGFVESVKPYLSAASVYVAPLFVGGGIRIKILEAMSMELPVVATSVSAEGIEAEDKDGLFIRDKAKEQAEIIIDLFKNPDRVKYYGEKARSRMAENYTWEKNVETIIKSYSNYLEN